MKSYRAKQSFLALAVLLLTSLACSLVSGQPAGTQEPAESTSVSVPSPEPTETPKPELGEILLEEKYADNSNNWYIGTDADTDVTLEDGKYKVRIKTLDNFYWFELPTSISDVDATIDAEFTEGAPENLAYGFLCNFKDADNHYRLRVAPDGTYSIDKRVNGGDAVSIVDWTPSSAIKQGIGATNSIRVICNEGHLIMYLNDTMVANVKDISLTGGSFEIMAGGYANSKSDKNPVGVNFSNLTIRKPIAWERPAESLLVDSFDDNKNDWDVFKEDKASAQIENGQLVMKVSEAESSYMVYPALSLSDVDLVFDATLQEGTPANSAYGAACRRSNTDNRYMFDISGDGGYTLNKKIDGKLETIIEWSTSNAIKTGTGETNRIHIICSGSNLELYVNDQLLISAQDTNLTGGTFTLQTGRFKTDDLPISVAFDNLELKYPEK